MKKIMVVLVALICLLVMPLPVAQAAGADLNAFDQPFRQVYVGPDIDSVAYDTELNGNYKWHFFIRHFRTETVSNPTISVNSTLDPDYFPNVDGFPATWSLDSLDPGEMWILQDLRSNYPVTFTLGYNCSRTMEPLEIPPGGGVQTVTIKVKPVDERYTPERFMRIDVLGSVVEESNSQPDGALPTLTTYGIAWEFPGWELGAEYTFSVKLEVENPWGVSFVHKPYVGIQVSTGEYLSEEAGDNTTIYDEILGGDITYSVPVEGNWDRRIFHTWYVGMERSQIISQIIAVATVSPYLAPVGSPFTFFGVASTGPIESYEWNFDDGTSDSGLCVAHAYAAPGLYDVVLTVTDDIGAKDTDTVMVVVYDPEAGFATGGGWIYSDEGADRMNPSAEGKATFGFVSKYKKGATEPTGQTQFQFKAGDLNFHSTEYQWLVVNQSGTNAQFKGTGTINGTGVYKFMLWAGDGDPDTFRIKIWEEAENGTETVRYDNGFDQPIGGGSIVIHAKK